jgi:hypothetical protein
MQCEEDRVRDARTSRRRRVVHQQDRLGVRDQLADRQTLSGCEPIPQRVRPRQLSDRPDHERTHGRAERGRVDHCFLRKADHGGQGVPRRFLDAVGLLP